MRKCLALAAFSISAVIGLPAAFAEEVVAPPTLMDPAQAGVAPPTLMNAPANEFLPPPAAEVAPPLAAPPPDVSAPVEVAPLPAAAPAEPAIQPAFDPAAPLPSADVAPAAPLAADPNAQNYAPAAPVDNINPVSPPVPVATAPIDGVAVPSAGAPVDGLAAPAPLDGQPANPAEAAAKKPDAPQTLTALAKKGKKGKQEVKILTTPPAMNKSVMFRQEYYEKYRTVLAAYKERLKNAALAPKPVATEPKKDAMTKIMSKLKAPEAELKKLPESLYINTILYTTPVHSSAWINGKKFSVGDNIDGIKLASVTPEGVRLEIHTMDYSIDSVAWAETFHMNKMATQPPNRRGIVYSATNNIISVMLRANQRFDTVNMVVREGKVDRGDLKPKQKESIRADDLLNNNVGDISGGAPMPGMPQDVPPMPLAPANQTAEITASFPIGPDGHFTVPASLNGYEIKFKADTGATVTAISADDAAKAGIDIMNLEYVFDVRLADGSIIKAAQVNIETVQIGNITLKNVNLLITQGAMAKPLMGMTLLSMLKRFSVENNMLTLVQ